MQKIFKQFQLYILMMIFWIVINGKADMKVIMFGTLFSVVIIRMTYHIMFELDDNIIQLPPTWRFIWFGLIVFKSIIIASVANAIRLVKNQSENLVFEVELDTKNVVIITLIANAITLTPGTITLDVKEETLKVIGYGRTSEDIEKMKQDVFEYQKPFLYRRK